MIGHAARMREVKSAIDILTRRNKEVNPLGKTLLEKVDTDMDREETGGGGGIHLFSLV
jgi:hypothetical protein